MLTLRTSKFPLYSIFVEMRIEFLDTRPKIEDVEVIRVARRPVGIHLRCNAAIADLRVFEFAFGCSRAYSGQ
jgi:hypothetical protein